MRGHIPAFERRPFALSDANLHFRENLRLDTVVRLPHNADPDCIPVGVVSKDYVLLPHTEVLDLAVQALEVAKINAADVRAELRLTELGERMALCLQLPDTYLCDPGDQFPISVRLECLNSVEGSTRFRAEMGWFRLVCSNGLRFSVTTSEADRRHVGNLQLAHIGDVLGNGLRDYQVERDNLVRWKQCGVNIARISNWVDAELRQVWGFKAATRAFHIAQSGRDVDVVGPFKGQTPTTIDVETVGQVPGSPEQASSLFDVSQVMAWLAKERRDLQEQVEWREQIPALMEALETRARTLVPA